MEEEKIQALIYKYESGQCSDEERRLVEDWYDEQLRETAGDVSEQQLKEDLATVYNRLPGRTAKRFISRISIAASLFIFLSVCAGLYFYSQNQLTLPTELTKVQEEKIPDTALGKTYLTLADGRTISISDAPIGPIALEQGVQISKLKDNVLLYKIVPGGKAVSKVLPVNVLTTSRGSQCQVILPDGTAIWINAASALKFPSRFSGKKRLVELEGEAYFEVAKNKSLPFDVRTRHQDVEVLGTHFNVFSYPEEESIKTTLLEGKVNVVERKRRKNIILKPGEQSTLDINKKLQVAEVDVDNAVAWRSGLFQFQDSDLGQVTRQLARWYNVQFEFPDRMPGTKLWGEFHRNERLEKALELLEFFDLDYEIVNKTGMKTVIVTVKR
jgi:transmembrane sensor